MNVPRWLESTDTGNDFKSVLILDLLQHSLIISTPFYSKTSNFQLLFPNSKTKPSSLAFFITFVNNLCLYFSVNSCNAFHYFKVIFSNKFVLFSETRPFL
jgi:hypothetical protein